MKLFLASFLILLVSCGSKKPIKKCIEARSVVELGSSNTKYIEASVNVCQKKLVKTIVKKTWSTNYLHAYILTSDGIKKFDEDRLEKLKPKIQEVIEFVKSRKFAKLAIMATGVFRDLDENDVDSLYKKGLGQSINVISAEEETLSALKALGMTKVLPDNFVLWDIGGATMQLNIVNMNKKSMIFLPLGANVLASKTADSLNRNKSPNPLKDEGVENAEKILKKTFQNSVSTTLTQVIKQSAPKVYGIGGVHNTIATVMGQQSYQTSSLDDRLNYLKNMHDGEIGGKYAPSQATNLILVRGISNFLGFKEINVEDVSVGFAYLVD